MLKVHDQKLSKEEKMDCSLKNPKVPFLFTNRLKSDCNVYNVC